MFVIGCICLVNAIASSTNFLYYLDRVEFNKTWKVKNLSTVIITECTSTPFVTLITDVITIGSRVYIPILLILFFNSILLKDLSESKNRVKFKKHRREIQFTFTVIFSSFMFFIFYLPVTWVFLFKYLSSFIGFEYSKEIYDFFLRLQLKSAVCI